MNVPSIQELDFLIEFDWAMYIVNFGTVQPLFKLEGINQ